MRHLAYVAEVGPGATRFSTVSGFGDVSQARKTATSQRLDLKAEVVFRLLG